MPRGSDRVPGETTAAPEVEEEAPSSVVGEVEELEGSGGEGRLCVCVCSIFCLKNNKKKRLRKKNEQAVVVVAVAVISRIRSLSAVLAAPVSRSCESW